jgi:receptor expression-enhancing protein 1/2/3/4
LLYRKFVHPALVRREQRIDAMIEEAQTRGYQAAVQLGGRGIRYVTD